MQWTGKNNNQTSRASYWQDILNNKPIKRIQSKDIRIALRSLASENKMDATGRITDSQTFTLIEKIAHL
ncbi:MAG: hypothetical protein ACI9N9_000611 [Enterobacterales bacterium]|jgi:hypothetical protein